jgi:cytochrome c556
MAERVGTATEVQDALERGFARLMSLRASLERVRRGAEPGDAEQLAQAIAALRAELAALRARTPAASPLAGGFVLPRG